MNSFYRRRGKRIFDLTIVLLGGLPAILVTLAIALLVWRRMGWPVIFSQARPDLHGQPFVLYKFRTMNDAVDAQGKLLPDEARLTDLGRWLRSTSLDELPELINVLKGEMSLVGPRPLLMQYLERYTPEQARRNEALPGLTGWAQVNGRNALSWEAKFMHDVWYVDHISLWLDLHILARTVVQVARREDISTPGSATAEEFLGAEDE